MADIFLIESTSTVLSKSWESNLVLAVATFLCQVYKEKDEIVTNSNRGTDSKDNRTENMIHRK